MEQSYGRILSIDAESIVQKKIAAYLEDSGFTVFEAETGEQGLALFRQEKPDLVLSDLEMPVIGGLEVLTSINHESPETPVIIVSGGGTISDAVDALRAGAWDYVAKPITNMAVLEHVICKALERARLVSENKIYREKLEKTNEQLSESLRILKEDQEAGRNVQFQLLPDAKYQFYPYCFQYDIIPSLYLSGDFVDYFKISKNHFGFYIADVSGHGASSAFVTVLLKSLMSQFQAGYQSGASETLLKPEQLLKSLSDEVLSAKLGKYLTMIYCVLDLEKNTLRYSVGGHHPSPILYDGQVARFLEGNGFAVGIFKEAKFSCIEISLPEKFTLAFFSDGILEMMPGKTLSEKESLLLEHTSGYQLTTEAIFEKMNIDSEKTVSDDVSLMLLGRS